MKNKDMSFNTKKYIKPITLNSMILKSTMHPFHLVDPSPWPFLGAIAIFFFTFGLVVYIHFLGMGSGYYLIRNGLIFILSVAWLWWRDVIRESTFEGNHTSYVAGGLRLGMCLFIISEIMVFFSFFWAFFHSSLNPTVDIGCVWPPKGITTMDPGEIPLLNTFILVTSGAWITKAQFGMLNNNRSDFIKGVFFTLVLAVFFTILQGYEYLNASFNISDGIFGSTFYMATGLHGSHVIVGTVFIFICLQRDLSSHFSSRKHLGFEFACWYWHFVDVVWLFLFASIYIWGS